MPRSNKHGLLWTISVHHNNLNAKPRQRLGPDKQLYAEKYRAGSIVFLEVAPPPVSLTFRQQENVAQQRPEDLPPLQKILIILLFIWGQCLGCVVTVMSKKRCSIGSGKEGAC